jgi:hypothetical protein
MLLLAKAALGMGATVAVAGAYVFHEGVIRVDVDESGKNGSHVHVWVPATVVPVALRVVPSKDIQRAARQAREFLPALRELSKELEKHPNAELVDVRDANQHVRVTVHDGNVYVDAVSKEQDIHVSVPAETIADVADRLEARAPGI